MQKLQRRADSEGKLDWSLHCVYSTVVRAHQHAAGAKGARRGGVGPESCRVRYKGARACSEVQGKPLIFVLTGGERYEQTVFESLMEGAVTRRAGGGRPRLRPERLVGDKCYSTEKVRSYLLVFPDGWCREKQEHDGRGTQRRCSR